MKREVGIPVFSLWLGFIRDEYKTSRRILLKNMDGNSAFRDKK